MPNLPLVAVIVGNDEDPLGPCHGWRPWLTDRYLHEDPTKDEIIVGFFGHDQPPNIQTLLTYGSREIVLLAHSFGGDEAYYLAKQIVELTADEENHLPPIHNVWLLNADPKPKQLNRWLSPFFTYPRIPSLLPHRTHFYWNGFGRPYEVPGCSTWMFRGHNAIPKSPLLLATLDRFIGDAIYNRNS